MSHWDLLYHWLNLHAYLVPLFIFLSATLEALAVVGIVIPGIALLFALTLIAGRNDLNFYLIAASGMGGAMTGDGISFWLGKYFQKRTEALWPFRSHPQWLAQGEAFFYKYGGASIIIGRFVGPLRTFVPLCAGILNMPGWRFTAMNLLSALAWAPFHILPGYLLGSAFDDPLMPGKHQIWFLIGLSLLIFLSIKIMLLLHRTGQPLLRQLSTQLPDIRLLFSPNLPLQGTQLGPLLLALFFFSSYLLLSLSLHTHCIHWLNAAVSTQLDGLKQPFLDYLFVALSVLGNHKPMVAMSGFLIFYWIGRGAYGTASIGALANLLGLWLIPWLINTFGPLTPITTLIAFPSPEALTTVLIWGFTGVVMARTLAPQQHGRPLALVTTLSTLALASGLYLHHYTFAAVLGGLLLGAGILTLLRYLYYHLCHQALTAREMTIIVLAALILISLSMVLPEMQEAIGSYAPLQPPLAQHRAMRISHHRHDHIRRRPAAPPVQCATPVPVPLRGLKSVPVPATAEPPADKNAPPGAINRPNY